MRGLKPVMLLSVAVFSALNLAQAQAKRDAVHDVVTRTFTSQGLTDLNLAAALNHDTDQLKNGIDLTWSKDTVESCIDITKKPEEKPIGCALYYISNYDLSASPPTPLDPATCASGVPTNQAYIFHVSTWSKKINQKDDSPKLISSNWYVYRAAHPWWRRKPNGITLVRVDLTGAGDPLIYGATGALILGIDLFDQKDEKGQLLTAYSVSVTQGTPENITDLSALISSVTGISSATKSLGLSGEGPAPVHYAVSCQEGTKKLPFDMSISEVATQNPPADSAAKPSNGSVQNPAPPPKDVSSLPASTPGTTSCSGKGAPATCSVNRTFTSLDHEYWDVSVGLATPGVRETKYTFSTTSDTVSSSVTRHTELYALLDLFPFGYVQPKDSPIPHINLGVPVTSKSLYRPYFGISENLTGWTALQKKLSLPVGINFFAGMTWMKTQELKGMPSGQSQFNSDLKTHRVWKPMFGIEVPVSSIASKLGKGGSASKNTNGTGNTGS